ncbi:hypothetical protein BC941DRAFT_469518 [Chlamydoabsidia padenii]|nr:hypothetical protein BC941DRAFT_469518 [Chlamydoabsidia padenii]
MPSNTVQIQIIPETDTLHLYRDETTTLNDTYDFRGHIRLIPIIYKKEKKKKHVISAKPIQVHHIHIRLQGYVQTMLTSDFSDSDKDGESGDQRWCKDTTTLPLLDRIIYSARGYANVTECVLDQDLVLTPSILSLNKVTDLPFHFSIENTQYLPPTIASPRHLICYYISATVHQQEETPHPRISSSSFPMSSLSLPILSSSDDLNESPLTLQQPEEEEEQQQPSEQQRKKRRFLLKHRPFLKSLISKLSPNPSTPSLSTMSSSPSFSSFHTSHPTISTRLPITIECHHLGSLYALQHQPRIRYCGARPSSLRYQVHLAKYVRLQSKNNPTEVTFQCSFFPLSPFIRIEKLVCYLIQYETYPLRARQINSIEPLPENQLETKAKKIGYKEQLVTQGESLDRISVSVLLNSPQLVPPVNTTSLQVTHKLSIPPTTPIMQPTHVSLASLPPSLLMRMYTNTNNYSLNISSQDPAYHHYYHDSNEVYGDGNDMVNGCKLPSYLDVMSEGLPPSPFLEDQMAA